MVINYAGEPGRPGVMFGQKELREQCDKFSKKAEAAEELWKKVKEDKTSSEEERIEGLKKLNDLLGSNRQEH